MSLVLRPLTPDFVHLYKAEERQGTRCLSLDRACRSWWYDLLQSEGSIRMIPQGGEVLSESLSLDLVDLGGKTFDFRLDPFV